MTPRFRVVAVAVNRFGDGGGGKHSAERRWMASGSGEIMSSVSCIETFVLEQPRSGYFRSRNSIRTPRRRPSDSPPSLCSVRSRLDPVQCSVRWVVFARGPLVLEGGRRGRAVAAAAEASPAVFEITLSLHEACRCLTPPRELRRREEGEVQERCSREEGGSGCLSAVPSPSELASEHDRRARRREEADKTVRVWIILPFLKLLPLETANKIWNNCQFSRFP